MDFLGQTGQGSQARFENFPFQKCKNGLWGAQAEREASVRGRAGNAAPNARDARGVGVPPTAARGQACAGRLPGKAGYAALHAGGKAGQREKAFARGKVTPVCRRAAKSRFLRGESLLALHAGGEQFLHRGAKRVGLRLRVGGVLALYGEVCLELGLGARRPDD